MRRKRWNYLMPKRASQKARKKQREEEKAQTMHLGGDLEVREKKKEKRKKMATTRCEPSIHHY